MIEAKGTIDLNISRNVEKRSKELEQTVTDNVKHTSILLGIKVQHILSNLEFYKH